MKQQVAFFKNKYTIVTPSWRIEGSVWNVDYEIVEDNQVIARVHKKWFAWMDADLSKSESRGFLFDLLT